MRRYLALILGIIVFTGVAAGFTADMSVVDRKASYDDPASFNVTVENSFNQEKSFRISSLSSPAPTGWFSYGRSKTIQPGGQGHFIVNIQPSQLAVQNNYQFTVNVRAIGEDEPVRLQDYFTVNSPDDIQIVSAGLDRNVFRPGDEAEASIKVVNTDNYPVTDYSVKGFFSGEVFSEKGTTINSGAESTFFFTFQIPEDAEPGQEEFRLVIVRDGEERQAVTQTVTVAAVKSIDRSHTVQDKIMEKTGIIRATNTGNSRSIALLNMTVPTYLDPLVIHSQEPSSMETGQNSRTYYWNRTLEPGETVSVNYTEMYWPPLVVLGFLIIGILGLKRLHREIGFSKSVKQTEDGITVHIELENKANHEVTDIAVSDFVPDLASVGEEFPMARPVIRKTGDGTRLSWEIEEMKPGEQRVFEYTIKPMFEVEGGVVLPEAELEADGIRVSKTDSVEVEFRP